MDSTTVYALVLAATIGLFAVVVILRGRRKAAEGVEESQFAVSTEGEKRCPSCGMGNMWTDRTCIACGHALR